VFSDVVVPLRARLLAVAEVAVERLGEKVSYSEDPKFLLEAADKTLHRLGYAPTRGPDPTAPNVVMQQNVYMADSQALANARSKLTSTVSDTVIEGEAAKRPNLSAPEPRSAISEFTSDTGTVE
jgi:hypothetical protein